MQKCDTSKAIKSRLNCLQLLSEKNTYGYLITSLKREGKDLMTLRFNRVKHSVHKDFETCIRQKRVTVEKALSSKAISQRFEHGVEQQVNVAI